MGLWMERSFLLGNSSFSWWLPSRLPGLSGRVVFLVALDDLLQVRVTIGHSMDEEYLVRLCRLLPFVLRLWSKRTVRKVLKFLFDLRSLFLRVLSRWYRSRLPLFLGSVVGFCPVIASTFIQALTHQVQGLTGGYAIAYVVNVSSPWRITNYPLFGLAFGPIALAR